jgi:uncharacterized membrane protein
MAWALVASLALNLFLAGVLGARLWREQQWRERAAVAGPLGRITAAMPESARDKVKAVTEPRQQELRDRSREARRARNEAMQALAADNFDRTRANAAFAEARQRFNAMSDLMQSVLIEVAATLTPEERVQFRERMAERERRWQSRQSP